MRNTDITLYSRTTVVLWQQARPYPTKDGTLNNQTRGYTHYLRGHQSPVKILPHQDINLDLTFHCLYKLKTFTQGTQDTMEQKASVEQHIC